MQHLLRVTLASFNVLDFSFPFWSLSAEVQGESACKCNTVSFRHMLRQPIIRHRALKSIMELRQIKKKKKQLQCSNVKTLKKENSSLCNCASA